MYISDKDLFDGTVGYTENLAYLKQIATNQSFLDTNIQVMLCRSNTRVRLSHDFKNRQGGLDFFTYRLRLKSRYWVKIVYANLLDGADR